MCSVSADVCNSTDLSSNPGELSNLQAVVGAKKEAYFVMAFFAESRFAECQIQVYAGAAQVMVLVLGRHCLLNSAVVEVLAALLVVRLVQVSLSAVLGAEWSAVDLDSDPFPKDIVQVGYQIPTSKLEVALQPLVNDWSRFPTG